MSNLVVKTNYLVSAVQNLSLVEARLIQLAILDARETGLGLSPDKPLTIHASRYAKACGINKSNAYEIIKATEDSLFNRRFSFVDDDGKTVKSRWLQQIKYCDGEGKIELVFTIAVVKGISRIDGAIDFFTQYLLSNTIKFKSVYSVRLYELMCQWKNADPKKIPIFDIKKLREQLGIDTKTYKMMADFKKRVLDMAVAEINEHSDLKISYTQVKNGRNIVGFKFKISIKEKTKTIDLDRDPDTIDMFAPIKMTDKQLKLFSAKLAREYELEQFAIGDLNDYARLAEWIEYDIMKPERADFYRPILERIGFKEK